MTTVLWRVGISVAILLVFPFSSFAVQAAVNPSGVEPADQLNSPPFSPSLGAELKTSSPKTDVPVSANPLWAIPLSSLTATRERPIFLPSRRVPPPPVVVVAPAEPVKPVYVPKEPEKPQLTLVGVVAGVSDGLAVFLNVSTHDIVRLKIGEGHDGWILRSVEARKAVLEKNHQTAVMGLPASEDTQK